MAQNNVLAVLLDQVERVDKREVSVGSIIRGVREEPCEPEDVLREILLALRALVTGRSGVTELTIETTFNGPHRELPIGELMLSNER